MCWVSPVQLAQWRCARALRLPACRQRLHAMVARRAADCCWRLPVCCCCCWPPARIEDMRREIGVVQHTNGTSKGADEVTLSELLDEGTFGKVLLRAVCWQSGATAICVVSVAVVCCAEALRSARHSLC